MPVAAAREQLELGVGGRIAAPVRVPARDLVGAAGLDDPVFIVGRERRSDAAADVRGERLRGHERALGAEAGVDDVGEERQRSVLGLLVAHPREVQILEHLDRRFLDREAAAFDDSVAADPRHPAVGRKLIGPAARRGDELARLGHAIGVRERGDKDAGDARQCRDAHAVLLWSHRGLRGADDAQFGGVATCRRGHERHAHSLGAPDSLSDAAIGRRPASRRR